METKEIRFSIQAFDFKKKIYRQYFFIEDSKDIENKIFHHTMNFFKCSTISPDDINQMLNKNLTSLCHKVNMVKHHLIKYIEIEENLIKEYENDINKNENLRKGTFFILEPELIAQEEAVLFQIKATLDFLMDFLNQIYGRDKKNEMKKVHTFENKGLNVIKIIKKYIIKNPDKEKYLKELVEHLETEIIDSERYDDGSLNWLNFIIDARDTISHYQISGGSLQINIDDSKREIFPPYFTRTQKYSDAYNIAYVNLLIFIEDFIALLIKPYIDSNYYSCFTYETDKVKEDSPKWYIMLKGMESLGLKAFRMNPLTTKMFYDELKVPMDFEECLQMHMYYLSFYKD